MSGLFNSIEKSRLEIANCELAECDRTPHPAGHPRALDAVDSGVTPSEAAVANDMIVSLMAGMRERNKQIVKDTVLFASLVADKAYPAGGVAWYDRFETVMKYCGWLPQSSAFSDYRASNSRFTMEQEGLKILASVITAMALPGPTSALMLKVASDTVQALQQSGKPLRLFETSSKTHNGAKFAIASAVETKDEEVVMALGALNFATSLDVTNVLFWEWNGSSVQIKRAESVMTLNQRHFEGVRDVINDRLAGNAREALAEFEI